jgi:hypothetical protein
MTQCIFCTIAGAALTFALVIALAVFAQSGF